MDIDNLMLREEWINEFLKEENVQRNIKEFIKTAKDAIPLLKEYLAAIPEICEKLQACIDDLAVQEKAVNTVNTTAAVGGTVSTALLFTPFAPVGLAGLTVWGIAAATTAVSDGFANYSKGKEIKKIVNDKKELVEGVEKIVRRLNTLIEKVAEHGNISIESASKICFGLTGVAKAGAAGRVMLQGDEFLRLIGLFGEWRAMQLAPGVVVAIAGIGSKLLGALGTVFVAWSAYDGWVNGNRTRNATIETKEKFKEAATALRQLIDFIEGRKTNVVP